VYQVMNGVRIVEVAAWTFVPAAGAVFADWGAEVIKIEHPITGDPQRGLMPISTGAAAPNVFVEQPNRGKRSVGIDIASDRGRELLYRLVADADVFLTNLLTPSRERLHIDVDDLLAVNPDLIYVRGTGQGVNGPDATKGGFDMASAWYRGGIGYKLTNPGAAAPVGQPAAFVDLMGGMTIAAGIAAALFHRERTGNNPVVDVSLFGVGAWVMSPDILSSEYIGQTLPTANRTAAPNPGVNSYLTKDDRWVGFVLLQSDRFWPSLCEHLGRPDLADDPRFDSAAARFEHREECVKALDEVFATRTLAEWRTALDSFAGVWAPLQSPAEIHDDVQALANGVFPRATKGDDQIKVVASPVRFGNEDLGGLDAAPEAGEHTDEVLLAAGLSWDELLDLKLQEVIA
jgi:crotonobetainyl-CoA:carnitine CoA-transferase CaiB-like acyl-CoA transferase